MGVVEGALEAVSVSIGLLGLSSSRLVPRSHVNLVRLGVGTLGHCHGGPLGLGTRGPGSSNLWDSGNVGKRSACTATPQTCPWSCLVLVAMISGTAGSVFSVLVTHSSSNSSLVLPDGDNGADVEDLSIFSN